MFVAPCQENCVTLGVGEQTAGISGSRTEEKKAKATLHSTVCVPYALRHHGTPAALVLVMPNMSYDSHDFLHVCIPI